MKYVDDEVGIFHKGVLHRIHDANCVHANLWEVHRPTWVSEDIRGGSFHLWFGQSGLRLPEG